MPRLQLHIRRQDAGRDASRQLSLVKNPPVILCRCARKALWLATVVDVFEVGKATAVGKVRAHCLALLDGFR